MSLGASWRLGSAYFYSRQYDAAIAQLLKTLATESFTAARTHLALAYAQKGMFAEAVEQANRLGDGVVKSADDLPAVGNRGYVLGRAGRREEARAVLAQLVEAAKSRYVIPLNFARVHIGLGENEEAFKWLERAYHERSSNLVFLRVDPVWDPIRADPRFADLVRRVGIPAPGEHDTP
jgi:tetratricopeptide (TPR) repeat protein